MDDERMWRAKMLMAPVSLLALWVAIPAVLVPALGRTIDAKIVELLPRQNGCSIHVGYQARPGYAPSADAEAAPADCAKLKAGDPVIVRYILFPGDWHLERIELPGGRVLHTSDERFVVWVVIRCSLALLLVFSIVLIGRIGRAAR